MDSAYFHVTPAFAKELGGIGPGLILFHALPEGMDQPQRLNNNGR